VATAEQYIAKAPLANYEHLRPWAERIEQHPNSLTADRTLAFFKTSGSTAKPKLIPVTPAVAKGTLVSNFIDASAPEPSAGGIEVCSESSFWSRRGRSMNTIQRWPLPAELRLVGDLDARLYAVARLLMQSELHCIMCLNPSTLLQFCRVIQTHSAQLIAGLRAGTWGSDDAQLLKYLDVTGKQPLGSYLRADDAAADRLAAAVENNQTPRLLAIWPMLKLVVCWRSNMRIQ